MHSTPFKLPIAYSKHFQLTYMNLYTSQNSEFNLNTKYKYTENLAITTNGIALIVRKKKREQSVGSTNCTTAPAPTSLNKQKLTKKKKIIQTLIS